MIRERYLHEMTALKEIAGHIKRKVDITGYREDEKLQKCLNSFVDRCFSLIDKMSYEYLKEEKNE